MTDEAVSLRQQRRIVMLLTILAALVGLLVLSVALGALVVARKLAAADAPAKLEQVVDQIEARQRAAAARLDDIADRTARDVATLEKEARKHTGVDSGPIDKLAQMIHLQQIMVDEQFLMLRHLAASQQAVAAALRPLPVQREERHDVSGRD